MNSVTTQPDSHSDVSIRMTWILFALLLISRPCFQYFNEYRFHGLGLQNISSFFLVTIFYILTLRYGYWQKFTRDIIFWIFLHLILMMLVSFFINKKYDPIGSLSFILRYTTFLIIYLYARYILPDYLWKKVLLVIIFSAIVPAIFALFQYITGFGHTGRGVNAVYATFMHPNAYGNYLVIVNLITLYVTQNTKFISGKTILTLFFFLNGFLIINTFGRAALISFIVVSFIFSVFYLRSFFIVYILGAISIFTLKHDIVNDWIMRFTELDQQGTHFSGRLELWSNIRDVVIENFLIGIGPNNWFTYYSELAAHNEYLKFLVEGGIVCISLFLLLWAVVVFNILPGIRKGFNPEFLLIFLIVCTNLFLFITSNLGSQAELQWIIWACIGSYLSNKKQFYHLPAMVTAVHSE